MRDYLINRLSEQSTWVGISAAIAGAALVPEPYSWGVIVAGIMAVIVPTRSAKA